MSKIDDALKILTVMGIPKAQQNDRSALTLLAVLDIRKKTPCQKIRGNPFLGYIFKREGNRRDKIPIAKNTL
jgi:adenine-specific DNA-methyltransferase